MQFFRFDENEKVEVGGRHQVLQGFHLLRKLRAGAVDDGSYDGENEFFSFVGVMRRDEKEESYEEEA